MRAGDVVHSVYGHGPVNGGQVIVVNGGDFRADAGSAGVTKPSTVRWEGERFAEERTPAWRGWVQNEPKCRLAAVGRDWPSGP